MNNLGIGPERWQDPTTQSTLKPTVTGGTKTDSPDKEICTRLQLPDFPMTPGADGTYTTIVTVDGKPKNLVLKPLNEPEKNHYEFLQANAKPELLKFMSHMYGTVELAGHTYMVLDDVHAKKSELVNAKLSGGKTVDQAEMQATHGTSKNPIKSFCMNMAKMTAPDFMVNIGAPGPIRALFYPLSEKILNKVVDKAAERSERKETEANLRDLRDQLAELKKAMKESPMAFIGTHILILQDETTGKFTVQLTKLEHGQVNPEIETTMQNLYKGKSHTGIQGTDHENNFREFNAQCEANVESVDAMHKVVQQLLIHTTSYEANQVGTKAVDTKAAPPSKPPKITRANQQTRVVNKSLLPKLASTSPTQPLTPQDEFAALVNQKLNEAMLNQKITELQNALQKNPNNKEEIRAELKTLNTLRYLNEVRDFVTKDPLSPKETALLRSAKLTYIFTEIAIAKDKDKKKLTEKKEAVKNMPIGQLKQLTKDETRLFAVLDTEIQTRAAHPDSQKLKEDITIKEANALVIQTNGLLNSLGFAEARKNLQKFDPNNIDIFQHHLEMICSTLDEDDAQKMQEAIALHAELLAICKRIKVDKVKDPEKLREIEVELQIIESKMEKILSEMSNKKDKNDKDDKDDKNDVIISMLLSNCKLIHGEVTVLRTGSKST